MISLRLSEARQLVSRYQQQQKKAGVAAAAAAAETMPAPTPTGDVGAVSSMQEALTTEEGRVWGAGRGGTEQGLMKLIDRAVMSLSKVGCA